MQTWLFVPGDRPDRIRKAFATEADRIIVDWEDAVAPEHKAAARQSTAEALETVAEPERCVIRVNPPDTAAHAADLDALDSLHTGLVMVAKTEQPDTAARVIARGHRCVPLIESALGVEQAYGIACVDGVAGLAFGCVDYLADIHAAHSHEALHYARGRLVNAARAAGLASVLDGPTIALDDADRLAEDALLARALGFSGKLAIHPRQITALRQLFRPSEAEVERAREIIRLYEEGLRQGKGAIRHGDLMIDGAVAKQAQRTLSAAGIAETWQN